ncbi:FeoA family protein [Variovorax sp. RHLX14]|uniref:FeoA family protein n=1 Tax=Variovorax sp. RHLX14 TaxID=1259731 RepID=UPI003F48B859
MPSPSSPSSLPQLPSAAVRLDELPSRQWATVLELRRSDLPEDRELVLRLTEIGFVPGQAVRIVASGLPGREPLAVRLGHTTFALRRHEASFIHVTPGVADHG